MFAFGAVKLSILFFYRRIFCSTRIGRTPFDIITKAMIAIIVIWIIGFGLGSIFLCRLTPSAAWGILAELEEKCVGQLLFLQGFAISDFITDFIILVLPLPMVRDLVDLDSLASVLLLTSG